MISRIIFLRSAAALVAPAQPAAEIEALERAFRTPPDDARIMVRWWWFGPSVTKPELEREMRVMKDGGIGGFEVQPVYPLALDDRKAGIRNLPYLSDEFLDALRFTSEKARELGLRMDLTLGSGWPYGGPSVPVAQAAGRLRWNVAPVEGARRIPLPYIGEGERLLAAFLKEGRSRPRRIEDIRDGAVWLPASVQPPAEVQFFISSRTGQMVKRPAVSAEGFVVDHYDGVAVRDYLHTVGDRLFEAFGSQPPRAIFCDSLEVYGSDWTEDFLEQFRKRRGYDVTPWLPALAENIGPETAEIRHDWGMTLTELVNERFLAPVHEWAKRHGTLFRAQAYGTPPATLSSYSDVDLPEGEGADWKALHGTRWASSASHLYGRPVTSSETWTWLHSPSFRATPLDVKAEADRHFLQGINQLIGHGWPYTAEGVEYPGWRFYAAAVFDEKNPWWIVMPDLALYLQRLSFLLRQGKPVADVAVYLPVDDAWAGFMRGRVDLLRALGDRLGPDVVSRVLEAGFNLDFFDDATLALVEKRYPIIVLPNVERIPVATLRKLEQFVREGGTLVATRRLPSRAPGWKAGAEENREVHEMVARLFEGAAPRARLVEDENKGLAEALSARMRADVALSPASPDIGFVHRSTGFAEIYFLANTGNARRSAMATFRVAGMHPEIWDPLTGRISATNGPAVALDFEPYGSRVVVFSKRRPERLPRAERPPHSLDLSTGWDVTFAGGRTVRMDRLRSWTDDAATRFYSGTAIYEKTVSMPDSFFDGAREVRLDFGESTPVPPSPLRAGMQAWLEAPVREAAVVYVNGRRAGSAWCPPYSVDVTGLLQRGTNRIRILAGNLAINSMAGRALPDYRLLNLRYGVRFEPQDMDQVRPVTAGLVGSIRLLAAQPKETTR